MSRHFLILIAVCFGIHSYSQNEDSLLQKLDDASPRDQFMIYVDLARNIARRDQDKALEYAHKAQSIAEKLNNDTLLANIWVGKGRIYLGTQHRDSAEFYYLKAYDKYRELNKVEGIYMSALNLGTYEAQNGNFEVALPYYQEAYETAATAKYDGWEADAGSALMGIGMIHRFLGNFDQALKNYDKCEEIFIETNEKVSLANIYNNKGNIYSFLEENDKALEMHHKALKLRRETGDSVNLARTYGNLGSIYCSMREFDKGIPYVELALERFEEMGDLHAISESKVILGEVYDELGQHDKAEDLLLEGLKIAEDINAREGQRNALLALSQLGKHRNDYEMAYSYFKKYHVLYDSLNKNEVQGKIQDLQAQYDVLESQKELQEAEKQRALAAANAAKADEKNARQRFYIALAGGATLLLLVGVVFLIRSNRNKQRTNREILFQKLIVEEKNKEITDSINYAKRLQDAILPPNDILSELLPSHFVLFRPKDIVSGDFYSVIHEDNSTFVAAVDCTGHGVPGAMMSLVGDMALKRSIKEFGLKDPGKILDKMTELVKERFEDSGHSVKDGMDMSLVKISGDDLEYAGANNPLWVIRNSDGPALRPFDHAQDSAAQGDPHSELRTQNSELLHEVKPDKQPIGPHILDHKPFTTHKMKVGEGDTIYLFSDGYADQFGGEKGKKFKYSNLKNLLISIQDQDLPSQKTILENTLDQWMGELEQLDDICILGIRTFISKEKS